MAKRTKPEQIFRLIETLDDADQALKEIAESKREIDLINLALSEEIALRKEAAKSEITIHQANIDFLGTSLVIFGDSKKNELFIKPKSKNLTFGKIGYQESTSLKNKPKNTWKKILDWLIKNEHEDCITSTPAINKEAMKKKNTDFLEKAGVELVTKDEFFYETNHIDAV